MYRTRELVLGGMNAGLRIIVTLVGREPSCIIIITSRQVGGGALLGKCLRLQVIRCRKENDIRTLIVQRQVHLGVAVCKDRVGIVVLHHGIFGKLFVIAKELDNLCMLFSRLITM